MRQMNRELAEEVVAVHSMLKELQAKLYQHGDHDVADAVLRAAREFEHPSVTGPLNQVGVS